MFIRFLLSSDLSEVNITNWPRIAAGILSLVPPQQTTPLLGQLATQLMKANQIIPGQICLMVISYTFID